MTSASADPESGGEVVACDLEGTLSSAETWRALAARLRREPAGRRAYRAMVGRRLPHIIGLRLGIADRQQFREMWLADLAGLLRGRPEEDFDRLAEDIVAKDVWPSRNVPLVDELERHRAAGRTIVLCSGTYQPVLEALARRLAAEALGTPLEQRDGCLTGRLAEPPNTGARKLNRLREWLAGRVVHAAYGDTLADVGMLELSREPVAVRPEPGLRRLAEQRGWRIIENAT